MTRRYKPSALLNALRNGGADAMPELRHSTPGEEFDIARSEVAEWLCRIPEVRQCVFNKAREAGLIGYDPDHGTWRGSAR